MKIGMPTLIELETLQDNVDLCKELNLDFIEINMNLPQFQIERLSVDEILNIQKIEKIFFTFHLPEDIDIAHFNKKIRNAHYEVIYETIDFMKKIKSPLLNMHMNKGIYFTLPHKKIYLYEEYQDEYQSRMSDFSEKMMNYLDESNITFAIENTGIFDTKFITDGLDTILRNSKFSLTWDIGHDFVSGKKDNNYMIKNEDRIKHMHIHDVKGNSDHVTLYDGNLDINHYIDFANNKKISAVIETKTIEALKTSILRLNENKKNIKN